MRLTRFSNLLALSLAVIAVLMLAGMLVVDLIGSRQKEIGDATRQIEQHDRILAEHVARSFDSIEVLLDEVRMTLQEGQGWQQWSNAAGHQHMKSRLTRSLPQVRHLIIFDADGGQRHTSFAETPPPINIRDRPYFRQLAAGAERSRYGPYIGRNSNRPTYALARRLSGSDGRFTGVLMVAIEIDYFETFCRSTRPYDEFEASIVNAEGAIVSTCHSLASEAKPPGTAGDDFRKVLAGGEFSGMPLTMNRSVVTGADYLLATEPVPGYPELRIVSTTPRALLVKGWRSHAQRILLLTLAALVSLAAAGILIRRQIRRLAALTGELEASRTTLEERIQAATQELDMRRNEAERLAEAKSRFFAAASHDLRQPLHALQLFLADLSRLIGNPEQRVLVDRIEAAARAMADQLRSLLDISRLDMANLTPERKKLALTDVFNQLAATYAPAAEAAGIRLAFRPRAVTLETDPALLIRLLGNLIDNAIKFSPGGTVLVGARWRVNAVCIEVRDDGRGIPLAHQRTIYDEFYQVGNRARDPDAGLGLGLAIAHRVARLLGTSISLRSAPDIGSTFALTLPCVIGYRPAKNEAAAQPRLVVLGETEPSGTVRDFAEHARRWGYAVESVGDAATAERMLGERRGIPVIVHADCGPLDGELQSLLRRHPGVVVTPADCNLPDLGAYHLREPVKPARLRALLRSLH